MRAPLGPLVPDPGAPREHLIAAGRDAEAAARVLADLHDRPHRLPARVGGDLADRVVHNVTTAERDRLGRAAALVRAKR